MPAVQAGIEPFCLPPAVSDSPRASVLSVVSQSVCKEDGRKGLEQICTARIGVEKRDGEKLFARLAQELRHQLNAGSIGFKDKLRRTARRTACISALPQAVMSTKRLQSKIALVSKGSFDRFWKENHWMDLKMKTE